METIRQIDLKSSYRFIEFTLKMIGIDLPHERFKEIIFDEYKVETIEELHIKRMRDAYSYLLNNLNQVVSCEIVNKAYYLLTNKELDVEINNKILFEYYKWSQESPHYLSALIHLLITRTSIAKNTEFAFLISNYIMLKRNRNQIIIYSPFYVDYESAIKSNNLKELIRIFCEGEQKQKNKECLKMSIENIDTFIKNSYQKMINEFKVEKLYLYGSYAKENNTCYSDVDFLVIFNKTLTAYEKEIKQRKLREFLSAKLLCEVDIMDFTYALSKSDLREMENIIMLI